MSKTGRVRIRTSCLTDPGMVREENQDACLELRGPDGEQLLLVADGMGGHKGGSTASRLLVEVVKERFQAAPNWNSDLLVDAITEGNAQIYGAASADIQLTGMGTTAVAVLFGGKGTDAWVAHVGDSRAYRLREERIERLTVDHSTVAELVRRGAISEEEANTHPRRNEILRSVGAGPSVNVEVAALDAQVGDCLLLCSDGLSGVVGDPEIAEALREFPPDEAVPHLVLAANKNGAPDNVTVMVSSLVLDETGKAEVSLSGAGARRMLGIAVSVAAALLLTAAVWLMFR
jgi:serine/threonine protein phosphatase PrpC